MSLSQSPFPTLTHHTAIATLLLPNHRLWGLITFSKEVGKVTFFLLLNLQNYAEMSVLLFPKPYHTLLQMNPGETWAQVLFQVPSIFTFPLTSLLLYKSRVFSLGDREKGFDSSGIFPILSSQVWILTFEIKKIKYLTSPLRNIYFIV